MKPRRNEGWVLLPDPTTQVPLADSEIWLKTAFSHCTFP